MRSTRWIQIVIAAAVVLVAGAALVLAEDVRVEAQAEGGEYTVKVVTDGEAETYTVEGLADGEERVISSGEHEIVLRRDGDRLLISVDGDEIGAGLAEEMRWVDDGGRTNDLDHELLLFGAGADGGGDQARVERRIFVRHGGDGERRVVKIRKTGDGDPVLIEEDLGSDRVRYRCADGGSELIVPASDDLLDSYVDPVTGCVMERVEERRLRVITLIEEEDAGESTR